MIAISDINTAVVRRPDGYAVQVYTRTGQPLWLSATRLTVKDAKGFEADVQAALSDLPCLWCSRPASRIDHIGELDYDVTDLPAFCSDDYCVREAKRELEMA